MEPEVIGNRLILFFVWVNWNVSQFGRTKSHWTSSCAVTFRASLSANISSNRKNMDTRKNVKQGWFQWHGPSQLSVSRAIWYPRFKCVAGK